MKNATNHFETTNLNDFCVKYYISEAKTVFSEKIYPPHVDDVFEFYCLFEGNASFSVENRVYKLSPGDVVVSKPNQIHNCILNSKSTHKHACFWFYPKNDFIFKKFFEMNGNLISPCPEDVEKLKTIYAQIKVTDDSETLTQLSLFLTMLDVLSKNISVDNVEQKIPPILKEILDDLNDNFTEINSLDYFTKKYSISSSTLNRLFKDNLNTSPKLFLETKRLAYSRILLRQGNSVMDSCMKSGFPDYSNYIRLFKKRFNLTPKQYKNQK